MSSARWIIAFLGVVLAISAPNRTLVAQRRAPRYLDRVSLTVRTISTVDGYLVYSYRFANAATSRFGVASFSLDVSAAPGTGRQLSPATGPALEPAARPGGVLRIDHVPAGPISPTRWDTLFDVDARLKWYGIDGAPPFDHDSIAPGSWLDGFGVRSSYLPGIRDFSAEPTWQSCCSKPKPGSVDGEHPDTDEFRVGGRTVGPMRAPTELADPVRAIALIRRDLAASCAELLWIDGPAVDAICVILRGHLSRAGAAAASVDRSAIGRHLDGLLKELDTFRGKGLNDNAYWLLRTNAQYVRDHLR